MKRHYVEVSMETKKLLKQEALDLDGMHLKKLMDEVIVKEYFARKLKGKINQQYFQKQK